MTTVTERVAPGLVDGTDVATDIGRLVVSCMDGPGIVARISGFLHARGVNIVQSDQYSTGPTGGRFFLRTEFHLPGLAECLPDLERDFAAAVPNTRWVADITYVPTEKDGWCYTAFIMDCFSRAIAGWACSGRMQTELQFIE